MLYKNILWCISKNYNLYTILHILLSYNLYDSNIKMRVQLGLSSIQNPPNLLFWQGFIRGFIN